MEKLETILYWAARLFAAVILLQTLFFKFTGSEESIYIFTTVGVEPWGRIAAGLLEMIAAILILFNRTAWLGSGLALGLMIGAIGMHLTILGVSVQNDGGYLFSLALIVTLCSAYVLFQNKDKVSSFVKSGWKQVQH